MRQIICKYIYTRKVPILILCLIIQLVSCSYIKEIAGKVIDQVGEMYSIADIVRMKITFKDNDEEFKKYIEAQENNILDSNKKNYKELLDYVNEGNISPKEISEKGLSISDKIMKDVDHIFDLGVLISLLGVICNLFIIILGVVIGKELFDKFSRKRKNNILEYEEMIKILKESL